MGHRQRQSFVQHFRGMPGPEARSEWLYKQFLEHFRRNPNDTQKQFGIQEPEASQIGKRTVRSHSIVYFLRVAGTLVEEGEYTWDEAIREAKEFETRPRQTTVPPELQATIDKLVEERVRAMFAREKIRGQ